MGQKLRNYDLLHLRESLAKEWAKEHGFEGKPGGWIYGPNRAGCIVTICQGWGAFWHEKRVTILDSLTVQFTAFRTFAELVGTKDAARPTLHLDLDWRLIVLAHEYNVHQIDHKDPRRVYAIGVPAAAPRWLKIELLLGGGTLGVTS